MTNQFDINATDDAGVNAAFVAAYYGRSEIFKFLINQGAQIKSNLKGTNPLHIASKKGFYQIVKFITHNGMIKCNPDIKKADGRTAAMLAC